ncbi:hypothetical protein [Methylocella silvestris]|uniref:Uncharacterized protein n=1 Tax=Methylocella silvestris TaxID=199596 RepID=A0A2J7TIK0_METSI|nr:hypothetical protein [Methylocella silvestris]PNG26566.1 hypothetical protein CR492_07725 [Methylocella silvestris]
MGDILPETPAIDHNDFGSNSSQNMIANAAPTRMIVGAAAQLPLAAESEMKGSLSASPLARRTSAGPAASGLTKFSGRQACAARSICP